MNNVRAQFDNLIQERCIPEELCCTIEICHKSEERMQDMINFILSNNLNCKLMNENSEEGYTAFYNYNRIMHRSLLYEGVEIDVEHFNPQKQPKEV